MYAMHPAGHVPAVSQVGRISCRGTSSGEQLARTYPWANSLGTGSKPSFAPSCGSKLSAAIGVSLIVLPARVLRRRRQRICVSKGNAAATRSHVLRNCSKEEEILVWLDSLGAKGANDVVVRPSRLTGGGLGVFAKRSFVEGERVCLLPREVLLVPEMDCNEGDKSVRELSQEGWLAWTLLQERKRGSASSFAPYIALLPDVDTLAGHPLFWPKEIEAGNVFAGSPRAKRIIAGTRSKLMKELDLMVSSGASFSDAAWALAMVVSRIFTSGAPATSGALTDQPDSADEPEVHLAPLLDLMNTATSVEDDSEDVMQPWNIRTSSTQDGSIEIWADRDIDVGDEMLITYGPLSSAELLAVYGFVPGDVNMFEGADLLVSIKSELARAAKKGSPAEFLEQQRAALQRHLGWNGRSRITLQLRSGVEGDNHVGGLLLPLARLLSLDGDADVAKLGQDVFWMCPSGEGQPRNLGLDLEVRARQLVQRWVAAAVKDAQEVASLFEEGGDLSGLPPAVRNAMLQLLENECALLEMESEAARVLCLAASRAQAAGAADELIEEIWDEDSGFFGAG